VIKVQLADEPPDFDTLVRQPGLRAIAELAGEQSGKRRGRPRKPAATSRNGIPPEKFPPYWTKVLDELMTAYHEVCAYSCFRIHRVTGSASVDHFAAKSRAWDRVYEWSNYRLCCGRMNARKREFSDVLDPFEVGDDWFQLELVGFQVLPNPNLSPLQRAAIEETIGRLNLNDHDCRHGRQERAEQYWRQEVSLRILTREAPFVARELMRQGKLIGAAE